MGITLPMGVRRCTCVLICLHACVSVYQHRFVWVCARVRFPRGRVCTQCELVCRAAVRSKLSVLINRDVAEQVSSIIASCQCLCVCSPLDNATWESWWGKREWSCLVATVKRFWGGVGCKEQSQVKAYPSRCNCVLRVMSDDQWTHHNSFNKKKIQCFWSNKLNCYGISLYRCTFFVHLQLTLILKHCCN